MKAKLSVLTLLAALVLTSSGCFTLKNLLPKKKPMVTKRFFDGAITYSVDTDAQPLVRRMVNLQGNAESLQTAGPHIDHQSDRFILPIYRDTDLDRDHHITRQEAETFFHNYVHQFEDYLGNVIYQ